MTALLENPQAMVDFLSDPEKVGPVAKAGNLGQYLLDSAKAQAASDASVAEKVRNQMQITLSEMAADNGKRLKFGGNPEGASRSKNQLIVKNHGQVLKVADPAHPASVLAGANGIFRDMTEFMHAIAPANANLPQTHALAGKLDQLRKFANDMKERIPADGGFFVPEETRAGLLQLGLEDGITRPRATIIPMDTLRVGLVAVDSVSNVSSLFGGITVQWADEGEAITASQGKFRKVVLDVKKLVARADYTPELAADGPAFQAVIDNMFPRALAYEEDYAFIQGTGVGQPLGWLNAGNGAIIVQAKESGQSAATIVWENIVKMYSRMLPQSRSNAVWVVSPGTFAELATMALAVGTGGGPIWLNNGQEGPPMTILGRPVIESDKVPDLGSQGDINFVDLSMYLIGDRQTATATVSTEYRFGEDMISYKIIQRVDGRPWVLDPITPRNNGATLSPFVSLAARA